MQLTQEHTFGNPSGKEDTGLICQAPVDGEQFAEGQLEKRRGTWKKENSGEHVAERQRGKGGKWTLCQGFQFQEVW